MKTYEGKARAISIAEFFDKNKQMLGFDSPQKALFMTVKEAVDNSLDACTDASILPKIEISVQPIEKDKFVVEVKDNGPGIPRIEVGNSLGKILYGSRFHAERQTRGQQGIGISAAILYAQRTTGTPVEVITKTKRDLTAYKMKIEIDIKKNEPIIISEEPFIWDVESGLWIKLVLKGKYVNNKQGIEEYIKQTAIANPQTYFMVKLPDKNFEIPRSVNEPPPIPIEIKPHPQGVELGELISIMREFPDSKIEEVLTNSFSRVSLDIARQIVEKVGMEGKKPSELRERDFEALYETIKSFKFMEPRKDCLSPIGSSALYKSVTVSFEEYHPSYFSLPVTKGVYVYSGHPFIIEAIAAYGGNIPKDEPVKVLRFANRVPLLYQAGSCAITKAISSINWNQYGISQPVKDQLPVSPVIIIVHVASSKIPFTNEAKEAIAQVPEIMDALDQALKALGRQIKAMKTKEEHKGKVEEKFSLIEKILPAISQKTAKILNLHEPDIKPIISKVMGVVAFRQLEDSLIIDNFTENEQSFEVHIIGEEKLKFEVRSLKPFERRELKVGKGVLSISEIYATLPDNMLLGAYTLPEAFKNE